MVEGLKQGAEAIPSIWSAPVPATIRARLVKHDVEALIASRTEALQHPGFVEIIPIMTMPCLVFAGEEDPIFAGSKECVRSMPNVTFFSLPGLGHIDAFFRSDLLLPHVTEFLAKVSPQNVVYPARDTRNRRRAK
jgi:hypothetical protein